MAGFSGFVCSKSFDQVGIGELERMVQCLAHEPNQTVSTLADPLRGIAAGWIPDGESGGAVQAWNASRDISLILFGEEFGSSAPEDTDRPLGGEKAARQIRAYEDKGPRFIEDLNGWFSGLLVDLREDKVSLFNDRYGLSRVYYHESADRLFFASEAKSLLAVLPLLRQIDQQGLAELFAVGCVLQNRSLFRDIRLLPGGSIWTFYQDGRIEKRRYFDPTSWEQQEKLDPASYTERLTEVFSRIAPRYLRGDQPVGMSLTGGLDSRMILAFAGAEPGSLPCYTFGGPYRDCADVRIARELASIARQPHETIRIEDDFFRDFPTIAEKTVYLTDGTMDVSGAVELYVNRKAREIAPIRVTGNYGSEILRSNIAFGPGRLDSSLFTPEFASLIREAADTYRKEAMGHRLSFIAFKQVAWHHFARLSVEKSQLTLRSPFLDNELVALAYRMPPELAFSPDPLLQLIEAGGLKLGSVRTDRALSRDQVPAFMRLAKAWQEFTAKAEYAYDYGMPKWLAKADRLLAPFHLERLFLGRHKFYHFRIWYRDQLRDYLKSSVNSRYQPSCFREGSIGQIVDGHLAGRANRTLTLHKMLTVQLIERFLVQQQ
jgi:asparagine synthase (glutamine-hydrolysing)